MSKEELNDALIIWFEENRNRILSNPNFWRKNSIGRTFIYYLKEFGRWKNAPRGKHTNRFPEEKGNDFDF